MAHYQHHTDDWFEDVFSLRVTGSCATENEVMTLHQNFLHSHEDDFELYRVLADVITIERMQPIKPLYQYASVNAVNLLFGSRWCFHRFLVAVDYEASICQQYQQIVKRLNLLDQQLEAVIHGKDMAVLKEVRKTLFYLLESEKNVFSQIKKIQCCS